MTDQEAEKITVENVLRGEDGWDPVDRQETAVIR